MADIASILPQVPPTTAAIMTYWKERGDAEPRRRYLGMSAIGAECERWLWYSFRHAATEDFPGRLYRLFNRGHREEAVVAEELRGIGCDVATEGLDGEQIGFVDIGGHFRGHMDGAVRGVPEAPKTWHALEIKTHSAKSFAELVKHGVAKAKPVHAAQMQVYMRYSGMTRALYVAVNKDTDEVYTERVRYDHTYAAQQSAKARRVILATKPPARIAERRDDFRCKFCPAKALCHGGGDVAVPIAKPSCRQCVHATPEMDGDGRWSCARHGRDLSTEDQERRCESFLLIPDFVTFADPVDAHKTADGDDVIEFKNHVDGAIWHHGPDGAAGHWSAVGLMSTPVKKLSGPTSNLLARSQGSEMSAYEVHGLEHLAAAWKHLTGLDDFPDPLKTEEGEGYEITEFPGGHFILTAPAQDYAEVRYNNIPY